MAGQWLTRSIV